MNHTALSALMLSTGLLLMGCDPGAAYIGTWSGATTLNSGSRTVSKSGVISIGSSGEMGLLVVVQMPLPTMDSPPLSIACPLPARPSGADLKFDPYDCLPVTLSAGCSMTLKVTTATATHQEQKSLKINGSGTVVAAGCGPGGTTVTDSFSFESLANR